MHDTEDKRWWCKHGQQLEVAFVDNCARIGLRARINPDKATNVYAPDLIVNDCLADLKAQTTPFFSARQYGMNPRFTVTFNRKDFERYRELYPDLVVYFWINWQTLAWRDINVKPLSAVFRSPFDRIASLVTSGGAVEHQYRRREDDRSGNARSSFLIDARSLEFVAPLHL
jgi:hypothetical protein